MIIIRLLLIGVVILLVFGAGVWLGSMSDNETEAQQPQKAEITNAKHTIVTDIRFADENQRDFIDKYAQFSISPNGEIHSLKGTDAVLLIQHDKEDWDWYNAAIVTDEEIVEKYEVPYGEHREAGMPGISIFDK